MNIIAKILILVLVNCFLVARPASAHDEDTMLRLISPTTPAEEKVKILTKLLGRNYLNNLIEFGGLIRDDHDDALSDSLVQLFRSSDFSGERAAEVQWLSLYWIANLKIKDAYDAIIDDALKSNYDVLREKALTAAVHFDDRRPVVIKAILKELERSPLSKPFKADIWETAARLAVRYRLEEAIEVIGRHLSSEIIDDDQEPNALSRQKRKNWIAIDALNGFPRLPQSLGPKLEAILENVEQGIFDYIGVGGLRDVVLTALGKLPKLPESLSPKLEAILIRAEEDLRKHDESFAKLTEDEKKNSSYPPIEFLTLALATLGKLPKLPESLSPKLEAILIRAEEDLRKHDESFAKLTEDEKKNSSYPPVLRSEIEFLALALATLGKLPKLPESLSPTLEAILAWSDKYLRKHGESFAERPHGYLRKHDESFVERPDDIIYFPLAHFFNSIGVSADTVEWQTETLAAFHATVRLQRAALAALDKIPDPPPFRLYAFVIVLALIVILALIVMLAIMVRIKRKRTS